jgi:hypothetical protein
MKKNEILDFSGICCSACFADELPCQERIGFLRGLENSQVEALSPDGSRLGFTLYEYVRPPYSGQHAYSREGCVQDADGEQVTVCLYADQNDRLLELELIKWSDNPIQAIQWETFKVS